MSGFGVRAGRAAAAAAVLAAVLLAAGCSGTAAAAGPAAVPVPIPLPAAATGQRASWAVLPMGGPASQHQNFWQLFVRTAGTSAWRPATPQGVADNGGLVVSAAAGRGLVTAVLPSQLLTFTALAVSADDGRTWTPGLLRGRLAPGPDALAVSPGGEIIAVTGQAAMAGRSAQSWATVATARALAAGQSGRSCRLSRLTGGAFTPSGQPLLAGVCGKPGRAGIFIRTAGTGTGWRTDAPALAAGLAPGPVTVLRLVLTSAGDAALLGSRTRGGLELVPAWLASGGSWTTGPAYRVRSPALTSASPYGTGWAGTFGGAGTVLAGPGSRWQPLRPLPAGTAALTGTPAISGGRGLALSAIASRGGLLTVWGLAGTSWRRTQSMSVPLPLGSSA